MGDFCVVYRPLYHCAAKEDRFEAHVLATSHFERFSRFKKISYSELDSQAKSAALPGPFWQDSSWGLAPDTSPVPGAEKVTAFQKEFNVAANDLRTATRSGYGSRSHQTY